eukprot:6205329-Pleurochrysis_carterae.AAC.1
MEATRPSTLAEEARLYTCFGTTRCFRTSHWWGPTPAQSALLAREAQLPATQVGSLETLNEYATCYISCYTRNPRDAKWPHVGVFGALGQVPARMRIYERLQKCSV